MDLTPLRASAATTTHQRNGLAHLARGHATHQRTKAWIRSDKERAIDESPLQPFLSAILCLMECRERAIDDSKALQPSLLNNNMHAQQSGLKGVPFPSGLQGVPGPSHDDMISQRSFLNDTAHALPRHHGYLQHDQRGGTVECRLLAARCTSVLSGLWIGLLAGDQPAEHAATARVDC